MGRARAWFVVVLKGGGAAKGHWAEFLQLSTANPLIPQLVPWCFLLDVGYKAITDVDQAFG